MKTCTPYVVAAAALIAVPCRAFLPIPDVNLHRWHPAGPRRLSFVVLKPTHLQLSSVNQQDSYLSPRQLVYQGMQLFRQGDVQGSVDKFNASVPPGAKPYLWQRGISYYYLDDFAAGSEQFRDDVRVSPLDVEEIVWDTMCLLRMDPEKKFPPPNQLSLPPGKKDRRPIMGTVYSLFRGEATELDLATAGSKGSPADEFYSLLYLSLFNESIGDVTKAEHYMRSATKTRYARGVGSQDYMVDVARVHCQLRKWT